jgi:O-antigen/teichoic acid export membrane protein
MLRSVGTVLRGSLFAQAIGFAILPLLTRLYAPSDFGALQLYQSILAILLVFATMRYEIAILRATSVVELKSLLVLCIVVNITIGLLLALGCGVLILAAPAWLKGHISFVIWLLPLSFMISGIAQATSYWLTRESAFSTGANAKIAQSVGYCTSSTAIGIVGAGPSGMVIADIAGKIFSLAWIARFAKSQWQQTPIPITRADITAAIRRYREFPLVAVPGGLVNALGGVMTPIMIYATFSASVSGQFGLVERSLTLPVGLLITAVSQVFSAQISSGLRDGTQTARQVFHRYVLLLFAVGIGPVVLVVAAAPGLFIFFFGPEWAQAGQFARLMAPAYLLMLVTGGTNMTLMLIGMQKTQMIWEIGRLLAMIALWTIARDADWPASQVVIGHACVIGLTCIIFLLMAEFGLRKHRDLQSATTVINLGESS